MPFYDISGDIQKRNDTRAANNLKLIQESVSGFTEGFHKGRETKRQRALKSLELGVQAAGLGVDPEAHSAGLDEFAESGEISGLKGLYSDISKAAKTKIERDEKRLDMEADYKKYMNKKLMNEVDGAGTPKVILKDQGAEGKKAVGSIASGLRALDKMADAMNRGVNPQYIDSDTPVLGEAISDNEFTIAQREVNEVIGRLQSQASVTKDEEARFKKMGPLAKDTKEIRMQKLQAQRQFLADKLTAFQLKEEDLEGLGFEKHKPSPQGPSDGDINTYAKQYNLSPVKAKEILTRRMSAKP